MLRGQNIAHLRRSIVAVIVASFATIATGRLLFSPSPNSSARLSAGPDISVAGRIDTDVVAVPPAVRAAPEPLEIALTLDQTRSDKLYLEEAGLDGRAADRWQQLLFAATHTRTFLKGHALTLFRDPETGELRGLRYNLDDRVALSEQTYGSGVLRASQELIRYTYQPVAVTFRLRHGFTRDADRLDLPQSILDTLHFAFQDRSSLDKLPRGSDVKLIYQEKVSRDGTQRFATGIQAAMITYGNKTLTAFAFRDETGRPRLYDANGQALEPQALRFPVNFTYISSGFSFRRYHPILHRYRAHEGVDLAAQYGTPVKAVADGQVEEAGWCGELGRCVRIRHDGGIVSIYGHLSRITEGIEPGQTVRMGEQIGNVGSSGLSTGPHLHYAIEKDGQYVNPLEQHLGVHHEVSPRLRDVFDHFKAEYLAVLNRLPLGGHYTVAPMTAQALGGAVITAKPAGGVRTVSDRGPSRSLVADRVEATVPVNGRASLMR